MTKTVRLPVEVDITCVNKGWFTLKKKPNVQHFIIGFFQRNGKAIISAMPNNDPETIKEFVLKHAQQGCILYTENKMLPTEVKQLYEVYELDKDTHVNGDIHVNNVKSMWKDLKRTIKQTHVNVSQKHLQLYCDEVAWRVNHRDLSPSERFDLLLTACATGKKRTYQDLIK